MSRAKKVRDPIFALIAVHVIAIMTRERANRSLDKLKSRIDARPAEKRKHYGRRLTCAVPFFDLGCQFNPSEVFKSRVHIKWSVEEAFGNFTRRIGPKMAARIRKLEPDVMGELVRLYDAFQRAHKAKRKACGLVAKEEAAQRADSAALEALMALVNTQPRTPEGRAALVRHFVGLDAAAAPWWAMKAVLGWLAADLEPRAG